jgi:hypothetical protein
MHHNSQIPSIEPGYTAQDLTKVPGWHGLVAWDLLFNNLTTGLFLFTAISELARPALFAGVARVAYPVALILLITDLMMLVGDLGDPLRFHHMLRVFKPSSPMSLGTWNLTVYSLPLTLIVAIEAARALDLLPRASTAPEWARKSAVIFGLLPAFGSLAYKGVLFSTSSQPGWKDARWLGGFMANSALALGSLQLLAIALLMGDARAAAALRPVAAVLLLLSVIPTGLVLLEIRETIWRIYPRRQILIALVLIFVVGSVLPLVLLLARPRVWSSLTAVGLVIATGLAIRALFIKIPHASHEHRSRGKT